MEKVAMSKSRVKVNVVTPTGNYGQVSDSFKLSKPQVISRNQNTGKENTNTGLASTMKKGSATPNIITTNPATYRTNGQLINKSSQNVL